MDSKFWAKWFIAMAMFVIGGLSVHWASDDDSQPVNQVPSITLRDHGIPPMEEWHCTDHYVTQLDGLKTAIHVCSFEDDQGNMLIVTDGQPL